MNIQRIKDDMKYIMINRVINRIPSWKIRKIFLKSFGLKIDDSARIGIGCIIIHPEKIVIGSRTVINENCHLDGRGGLTIGKDCSISIYTKIITASHKMNSKDFSYYESDVIIGDNVWVGCGAIILDGSKIKDRSVIGAGTVFKGVANKEDVFIGNPARLIKKRNLQENYEIHYNTYFR